MVTALARTMEIGQETDAFYHDAERTLIEISEQPPEPE
jgi:hypothetical protein